MQSQGLLFVDVCQRAMRGLKRVRDQETYCGLPPDKADASSVAGKPF